MKPIRMVKPVNKKIGGDSKKIGKPQEGYISRNHSKIIKVRKISLSVRKTYTPDKVHSSSIVVNTKAKDIKNKSKPTLFKKINNPVGIISLIAKKISDSQNIIKELLKSDFKSYLNLFFLRFVAFRILRFLSLSFLVFIVYLSVFDYYFYIKKYDIILKDNTFISQKQVQLIVDEIRENKLFGIIPLNNYWFTNENSLNNLSGNGNLSFVNEIKLVNKSWPNKLVIDVKSEKVLATLAVKTNHDVKYIVIDYFGNFLGYDNENLRLELININSPLMFNGDNLEAALKIDKRPFQLEKIWFAKVLKDWFNENNLSFSDISLSSLSDVDPDVIVTTNYGAKFIFDYTMFDPETQKKRFISVVSDPEIRKNIAGGNVDYVDFRADKKVFWCMNSDPCSISKNS